MCRLRVRVKYFRRLMLFLLTMPSERLLNSAWKKARQRAHLSDVTVHDLRRTCATRLRDCGVSRETRRDILGHTREQGDMARLYAWPTLRALHEAVEVLCEWRSRSSRKREEERQKRDREVSANLGSGGYGWT